MKKEIKNLNLPPQNHPLKPFDITFKISSVDEARMFLLMLENSPTIFGDVIDDIKIKARKQGYIL